MAGRASSSGDARLALLYRARRVFQSLRFVLRENPVFPTVPKEGRKYGILTLIRE